MQESTFEITTNNFVCPITFQVMDDPAVAADGYTYERKAIEDWLQINMTSPLTNLPMPSKTLIPNYSIKSLIAAYKEKKKKEKEELLKSHKRCLVIYSEIPSEQKVVFDTLLKEYKTAKKLITETIEDEWNGRNDCQKYELLLELKLEGATYSYLTMNFKGYLSAETQEHRHQMKDANGKYSSTEEFWFANSALNTKWIEEFLKSP